MSCRASKAAAAGLSQATALWPNRNRASDGTCASQAHSQQNPSSDHEPNEFGEAMAFDLTDDPAHGIDTWALWDDIRQRRDPRVKYGICDRQMFSSYPSSGYPAWTWRPYSGSNPHTTHGHMSILDGHQNDTSPWFSDPAPPPLTGQQKRAILAAARRMIRQHPRPRLFTKNPPIKGPFVREVQRTLDLPVTGEYGPGTRDGVAEFQRVMDIGGTAGEVDQETWIWLVYFAVVKELES